MAQVENELKYELDEASYLRILELLAAAGEPRDFCNIYLVAEGGEGRRDWNLRLRQIAPPGGELTLKVGRETSPGMFSALEYTAQVSSDDPADWEGTEPIRFLREEVAEGPIRRVGYIRNLRCLLVAPFGPVERWELDRAELPGGRVVYELEIEYPPDAAPSAGELAGFRLGVEEWLSGHGLPVRASRKTKYRRFLEAVTGPA